MPEHCNDISSAVSFGTAGWSYDDWRGWFYPKRAPRRFSQLGFLSRYLSVAEINTSFYRIPDPSMADGWLRAVEESPDFRFTMKLWQTFTHDSAPIEEHDARAYREVADRLFRAGRLAGVLAQFPWSFRWTPSSVERVRELRDRFSDYPMIVEVRHDSWMKEKAFDLLRELECSFCNIDQPIIGASMPPTAIVAASPAYVRLHGRRYDTWFAEDAPAHERYNYLYRSEELSEWADRIKELVPKAEGTLVIANNHFNAKAVATALELEGLVTGEKPAAPPDLIDAFPHLSKVCRRDGPPPPPEQLELF